MTEHISADAISEAARRLDVQVIRRQVSELVGEMIKAADARNNVAPIPTDPSEVMRALYAHTDAMRDLREALAHLGILS